MAVDRTMNSFNRESSAYDYSIYDPRYDIDLAAERRARERQARERRANTAARQSGTGVRQSSTAARQTSPGVRQSSTAARHTGTGARQSGTTVRQTSTTARQTSTVSRQTVTAAKQYPIERFDRPVSRGRQGTGTRTSLNGAEKRTPDTAGSDAVRAARAAEAKKAKEAAKQRISPALIIRTVVMVAVAAFVVTMMIISHVRSHELTRSIQETQAGLTQLRQEYDIMMDQFNTEMSDSAVEEYARSNFGMEKCTSSQTEYISLDSDEYFEFGAETNNGTWTTHGDSN